MFCEQRDIFTQLFYLSKNAQNWKKCVEKSVPWKILYEKFYEFC